MSTKTKAIAIAVMVGLFLLGGVTGAAAMRTYQQRQLRAQFEHGPGPARAKMRLRAMRRLLDLSDAQATEIEAIMGEAQARHHELFEQCGPELEKLRTDTEGKIEKVLTDEQRVRYEKLLERRRKGRRGRRGHRRRRGGPPIGPPDGPPPPPDPPR